jgi:alpha-1,6-mannosyltransferase
MPLLIAAILIEALLVCLVRISGSIVESILLLLVVQTIYLFSVHHVLTTKRGTRLFIIAAAIVFRITLAPLPAPFTDDLYRYRWEALVQDSGGNPYQTRPVDPQWKKLRDQTFEHIPAKDFKAGYGPAWEKIALWTLRIVRHWSFEPEKQALWFKAPAALFDLGIIGALLWLLRLRGLPSARVLIYAWSPLPIWEFWGNGHNDAMAVFFLIAALAFAASERWSTGSLFLGLAVAAKWWPALLLPAFARAQRSFRPYLIAAAVAGGLILLYATDATENAQFMSGFVGGWRNNDSIFGAILYLMGDPYRAKYLTFSLIGALALWLAMREWPLERIALWTLVSLLLLSANCHPWYLTWIVPLLAFYPHPSLLLWVALVPLAYSVQIEWRILGEWNGVTPERWWIYTPVFAGLLLEAARKKLPKVNAGFLTNCR